MRASWSRLRAFLVTRAQNSKVKRNASISSALGLFGVALPLGAVAQAETRPLDPELIRARCEVVHRIEDQSVLFGHVVDGRTGMALPGGKVYLRWVTSQGVADSTIHRAQAEAVDGAYIFCDLPQGARLTAWAHALGHASQPVELFFEGGETTRRDLEVAFQRAFGGVAGRLIDASTGEPIEAAAVLIPRADDASAVTDNGGAFHFPELPTGQFEATIRHVAYGQPTLMVEVSEGRTTHLEVRLTPEPIALEPIAVAVSSRPQWLENNGFYHRQNRSLGQFVSPEDIAERPWRRFSQVLSDVPGVRIFRVCNPHCEQIVRMTGTTRRSCRPEFYIDGRRLVFREAWIDLDGLASSNDLAAIEVYRSIAETPPQFYGLCGSVVIWTKRGTG